jgi:hypothetical protein
MNELAGERAKFAAIASSLRAANASYSCIRQVRSLKDQFAYFRNLLRYHTYGSQVPVKLKTVGVDVSLFAILLRYLYTDSINLDELRREHREILMSTKLFVTSVLLIPHLNVHVLIINYGKMEI